MKSQFEKHPEGALVGYFLIRSSEKSDKVYGKFSVPVDVACSLDGVAYDYPYGCSLVPLVTPSYLDVDFVVHSLASYLLVVFSFDQLVIVDLFVIVVVVELVVLEHYPLVMLVMDFEVNSQYIDYYNFHNFRTYYLLVHQHSSKQKKTLF